MTEVKLKIKSQTRKDRYQTLLAYYDHFQSCFDLAVLQIETQPHPPLNPVLQARYLALEWPHILLVLQVQGWLLCGFRYLACAL